jgi:hypothetical protein
VKWGAAIVAYLLVISYLTLAGRSRPKAPASQQPEAEARP